MNKPRKNLVFVPFQVRIWGLTLHYFIGQILLLSESLRSRLGMDPYGAAAATEYPLNDGDDWLRKRQGLALPVLPPTTPEARKFFFLKIREFSEAASVDNKKTVNFEAFAQEWNRTADGKERFYVTTEVLSSYAKSWEKISNVRTSQELISKEMQSLSRSSQVFMATQKAFPNSLTSAPTQIQPSRGVIEIYDNTSIPASISTALSLSRIAGPWHPGSQLLEAQLSRREPLDTEVQPAQAMQLLRGSESVAQGIGAGHASNLELIQAALDEPPSIQVGHTATKRRRVIPEDQRRRQAIRTCRRCREATCPGNSDILQCRWPCKVPCKTCGLTEGCRGVDGGRTCTFVM
jgi:hypothetical protein